MNNKTASLKPDYKLFLTIFFCFTVLFLGFIAVSMIRILYLRQTGDLSSAGEITFFSPTASYAEVGIPVMIASTVSMLLAGFIAGIRTKTVGWLNGALIGVLWSFFCAIIVCLYYLNGIGLANQLGSPEFIRENFTQKALDAYIATVPRDFFRTVFICGLGGAVVDVALFWRKRMNAKKVPTFRPKSYDELFKNNY